MTASVSLLLAVLLQSARVTPGATPASSVPADSSVAVSSLADLVPGDELTVHYDWHDCFRVMICDLTFRRDARLTVTVVVMRIAPAGIRGPRRLATLAVTDSTVKDLDELVRFYRAGPTGFGRGADLALTQVRNGEIVARESLIETSKVDRTGSYGFHALIDQAWESAGPGARVGIYR